MDDKRSYDYRYYAVRYRDTTAQAGSRTTQGWRQLLPAPTEESRAGRRYLEVRSFEVNLIQVEVTEVKTQQKMELTFQASGLDYSYNFLFDFAAGSHYLLTLGPANKQDYGGYHIRQRERLDKQGAHWLKLTKQ